MKSSINIFVVTVSLFYHNIIRTSLQKNNRVMGGRVQQPQIQKLLRCFTFIVVSTFSTQNSTLNRCTIHPGYKHCRSIRMNNKMGALKYLGRNQKLPFLWLIFHAYTSKLEAISVNTTSTTLYGDFPCLV